jgi:cbb3-type cytochrome c oxidase subunit III
MRSLIAVCSLLFLAGVGILAGTRAFPATAHRSGAAIYKQRCAACHGARGKGAPGLKAPDFTDPEWQASTTDKAMTDIITLGKKDSPMPAFNNILREEEIGAVVTYVRSLNRRKKK